MVKDDKNDQSKDEDTSSIYGSSNDCQCSNSSEVERLKLKLAEYEAGWRRALADYQNLQKRYAHEKEEISDLIKVIIVNSFLPILDNLLSASEHDPGCTQICRQFKKVLLDLGAVVINALGKMFDPKLHEAVDTIQGEKDKVIEVLNLGFVLGEQVIRPSRVKIGKG